MSLSNNRAYVLYALVVSAVIAVIIGYTLYKTTSVVDKATGQAVQILHKALNQAGQQVNQTLKRDSRGSIPGAPSSTAISMRIHKLTACIVAAGTDYTKIQACQAKFKP